MRLLKLLLVLPALLAIAQLSAEIHPKYYAEMQQSAPEKLEIEVKDVDSGWCFFWCGSREIEIEAIVTRVTKSASGLTIGQSIQICYTHFTPGNGWAGPRPIPILKEDRKYPAYLSKDSDACYGPAARGYSFESVD